LQAAHFGLINRHHSPSRRGRFAVPACELPKTIWQQNDVGVKSPPVFNVSFTKTPTLPIISTVKENQVKSTHLVVLVLLVVLAIAGVPALAQEDAQPIAIGDTVEGELAEMGQQVRYQFDGAAGDTVLISMTTDFDSQVDAYLILLGPDGAELSTDDDSGSGFDAQILVTLPAAGTYTVVAKDSFDQHTGAYTLSITISQVNQIAVGETVEGEIAGPDEMVLYQFAGNTGDVVVVTMSAVEEFGLDPYLALLDVDDLTLAYDDDSGIGNDALLYAVLLADGTYTLTGRDAFGENTGAYTLSLGRPEVLESGVTVSGTFADAGDTLVYTFETGQAMATVNVAFTASADEDGSFPSPAFEVYDVQNNQLVNATGLALKNFSFLCENPGTYVLKVSNYGWNVWGSSSIELTLSIQ
jgi:hypothetical protein